MKLKCHICCKDAIRSVKLQDPRRGHGEDIAYVRRNVCSMQCEEEAIDELDTQAQIARVAH